MHLNHLEEPAVAEKVRFLSESANLGEPQAAVECIETHFAWVFLTLQYAYKLRKPVCYRGLDTLSVEARRARCNDELRLNKVLAPDVYLGVLPLTIAPDGKMSLGENGQSQVIDWLLRMRRLPAGQMFDRKIRDRCWGMEDLERLSAHLQALYSQSPPVRISGSAYCRRVSAAVRRNRDELMGVASFGIDTSTIAEVASLQESWINAHRSMLLERAKQGAIRDCHGDLKPEHVCFGPPVSVIDRLEFDADLRLLDPIEDLCFLWLECSRLGAPEAGEWLVRQYVMTSGGAAPSSLIDFYLSQRALTRAKLAAWRLAEPGAERARWRARVAEYIGLAANAIRRTVAQAREPLSARLEQRGE